jgi:SAM-dependent methyltransferase
VLSDAALAALYRESRFLYQRESRYAARTYAKLVTASLPRRPGAEQIRLLEIGCGNGAFLEEMLRRGVNSLTGVEPSVQAVGHAAEQVRPLLLNRSFHPGIFAPETFDIVCAFHVLDHLRAPGEFLRECFRILRKRGMIILVCHDVDALVNRVLGEYSPVFDVEHIFLFNPATLRLLAQSCGFIPRREGRVTNTYPLSYWLRYVPLLQRCAERLPLPVGRIPLSLYAGNRYLCAQKD